MDIQQARDFISGMVTNKQKEIDAYNVALSILDNTFQAEFKSRDEALSEAKSVSDQNKQLQSDNDALVKQIADLDTAIATKQAELDVLTAEKAAMVQV